MKPKAGRTMFVKRQMVAFTWPVHNHVFATWHIFNRRRVFDPFEVQLRISKSASMAQTNSPEKGRAPGGSPMPQPSQGQEIRLIIPQIGAIMDSKEFEVLTDVISHVGMAEVTSHFIPSW